jgi:CDP-diacylglycerol--glycerol-3-phosphate 3-phosphatidyltransferase
MADSVVDDLEAQPRPARIGSPANLLGIARILATPVIVALMLIGSPGLGIVALVLFCLAAFTDFLDGWVARARGEVSPLGVFMDLTADKVLVAGVLVAMVEVRLLPTWLVALLLIRELVVQGVRQLAASADVVIASRRLGKGKTFATLVGMGLLLLAFDAANAGPLSGLGVGQLLRTAGYWTVVLATLLSVASGWGYIRGALPLLLGRDAEPPLT